MKPRHAAVLALLGWNLVKWNLMFPPLTPNGVDPSAPLSKWEISSSYDTADECEESKTRKLAFLKTLRPAQASQRAAVIVQEKLSESQCVAGDDPRLKAK
jgi:hypothetical protein